MLIDRYIDFLVQKRILKMVKTCIVCGFSQSSNVDVTFHRFPSDKNILNLWCEALQLDSNKLKKYSYICSNHFHPENIIHLAGRTVIMQNVIPVLSLENIRNVELDTSPQYERDGTDEGGRVNQSFASSSTAPEMLESDKIQNSEFPDDRLEESFSTSTASEAVFEMERNEGNNQPEKKFEDSFSTSTASEALMEMEYIEQNEVQQEKLENSFLTSTASEAVLEMERNEGNNQPEKKFEDSFSTSTASEALMEMEYIEQNELQPENVLGNPKVLSQGSGEAENVENVSPLNETELRMATTSYKRSNSMESAPRKRYWVGYD